jgi:hypothetical protein
VQDARSALRETATDLVERLDHGHPDPRYGPSAAVADDTCLGETTL